jgi:hypothetical protein
VILLRVCFAYSMQQRARGFAVVSLVPLPAQASAPTLEVTLYDKAETPDFLVLQSRFMAATDGVCPLFTSLKLIHLCSDLKRERVSQCGIRTSRRAITPSYCRIISQRLFDLTSTTHALYEVRCLIFPCIVADLYVIKSLGQPSRAVGH